MLGSHEVYDGVVQNSSADLMAEGLYRPTTELFTTARLAYSGRGSAFRSQVWEVPVAADILDPEAMRNLLHGSSRERSAGPFWHPLHLVLYSSKVRWWSQTYPLPGTFAWDPFHSSS